MWGAGRGEKHTHRIGIPMAASPGGLVSPAATTVCTSPASPRVSPIELMTSLRAPRALGARAGALAGGGAGGGLLPLPVEAASQEVAGDLLLLPLPVVGEEGGPEVPAPVAAAPAPPPARARRRWLPCQRAAAAVSRGYDVDEHLLPVPALAARLGTALDAEAPAASRGLGEAEAAARLRSRGRNELTPPPEPHVVLVFLAQLTDLLLLMLLLAVSLRMRRGCMSRMRLPGAAPTFPVATRCPSSAVRAVIHQLGAGACQQYVDNHPGGRAACDGAGELR